MEKKNCPCHSGKPYGECCAPYHRGKFPETALKLMRSRYSAYALGFSDYIIQTTHKENPAAAKEPNQWKKDILDFSKNTIFEGLEILSFIDGENEAFVTFRALLKEGDKDVSFTEESRFFKVGGRWLYHSGQVPHAS
ncbi:MAG TPA: YchJ family metal-binding protein [Rhabdochlamydiaceae bacterium]|nr:YchJ family metal-binding protein [Rhabdochlamydiaceae bacterium]